MNALISSMAGLALIASGAAWAGETGESQGSQAQKPHKTSETYGPQEPGEADPGGTGGQTSQGQGKAKQQTTGQESEKSSYFDDAMITTKVKAALAQDAGTSAIKISVETNDQTVQLTGSVESEDEKNKAESIARSVDGVKEVQNKLTVKG